MDYIIASNTDCLYDEMILPPGNMSLDNGYLSENDTLMVWIHEIDRNNIFTLLDQDFQSSP